MQTLEHRKNQLWQRIQEIRREDYISSLENLVYNWTKPVNPALQYVKPIHEKFDLQGLIAVQAFSMQKVRAAQGQLADEDNFEDLLKDL